MWNCESCRKKVIARKQLTIYREPLVLTVQLKRFSFHGMYGGKINKHIAFPEALDLAPYMSDFVPGKSPAVPYDLYGVVVHAGHDAQSGHYFSFVKPSTGAWHLFDDSCVRPVGSASVLSARAYMLM
jgi:ubiquitin carboxyl-terminal hydrolase 36/42